MFGLHPCRWLGAHFLVYTPTSMGVCMHLCKESSKRSWRTDRQRAVGIRVHAGSWAVQAMLSVSVESQRGKWERWRKRGGGEGGGEGGCQSRPCGKNSTGGGRGHATSCEGTVLKREVVNPVWAGYPTLYCVPSFRKGLSPRSHVGGD